MQRLRIAQETEWLVKEKYHGRITPSLKRDIARLQKGEPIDSVIGFVDFLGCKIDLSKRPFIPRPETEYWVEKAISDCLNSFFSLRFTPLTGRGPTRLQKSKSFCIRCLDLFAGSGCIGVAVLKHVPNAVVDFAEKEKKFLQEIKINTKLNAIHTKRYRIIQSDVFSHIKGTYDYIFANPPYIAESRRKKVQSSVLKYEPREALFSGKDGLDSIRVFLRQAKDFLVEGGKVYLEFDSFQKRVIEMYLKKLGYQSWQFYKDQYDKWRFVVVKN